MPLKTLIEFGLSEKEARVYLALIELEVAGGNDVARKAGINRSSTYVVLDSLKKKGLVSMSPDKNIQHFIPASPQTLLDIARENNEKATLLAKKIEKIIPELKSVDKKNTHIPKVVVYEGDEANTMSHYFSFGPEFRIYKDLTGMSENVPADYVEKDAAKRKKEKVKMFMISPNTEENRDIVKRYKAAKSRDEITLIPKEKFSRSKTSKNIGIGIYKDRVKFASTTDKFAIYIINQEITDTLRDLFDLAWDEAKRLG